MKLKWCCCCGASFAKNGKQMHPPVQPNQDCNKGDHILLLFHQLDPDLQKLIRTNKQE